LTEYKNQFLLSNHSWVHCLDKVVGDFFSSNRVFKFQILSDICFILIDIFCLLISFSCWAYELAMTRNWKGSYLIAFTKELSFLWDSNISLSNDKYNHPTRQFFRLINGRWGIKLHLTEIFVKSNRHYLFPIHSFWLFNGQFHLL
jgi:hypothetical protein